LINVSAGSNDIVVNSSGIDERDDIAEAPKEVANEEHEEVEAFTEEHREVQ
jgi:hypothetical protein